LPSHYFGGCESDAFVARVENEEGDYIDHFGGLDSLVIKGDA